MNQTDLYFSDVFLSHQISLLRFTAGEQNKTLALLKQMQVELKAKLNNGLTDFSKARVNKVLKEATGIIDGYYAKTTGSLDSHALAQTEAKFTANTFAGIGLNASLPSEAALKALVNGSLIEGAQSSAWWARQSEDVTFKFANQVRQGIVQNETLQQIIRRVAGSKRLGIPGIMDISRRNASALVHTSIMQVANDARLATFKANDDIIKGMRFLATLDSHTCWSPETKILMSDGKLKSIGKIKIGDLIIGGLTGKICKVKGIDKNIVASSVAICYPNGKYIGRTTHGHRMLTSTGWKETGDICLLPDIYQRKVLCRCYGEATNQIQATSNKVGKRIGICPKQCMEKVRRAGVDDSCKSEKSPRGFHTGKEFYQNTKNESSSRVQHDRRRGGGSREVRGVKKGSREEARRKMESRSGIQKESFSFEKNIRAKGVGGKQKVLCNAGRERVFAQKNRFGMAIENNSFESKAPDTIRETSNERRRKEKLAKSGIQREGKQVKRSSASGLEGQQSSVGSGQKQENVGIYEREMERPCLSGKDEEAKTSGCFFRDTFGDMEKTKSIMVAGETGNPWSEGQITVLESENVEEACITGESRNKPVEIISLSIDGDISYVAGGIIVHNSLTCIAHSGAEWDMEGKPIVGNFPFEPPPLHFNCRSMLVPVTLSYKELGIDVDKPKGTRASDLGQIKSDTTFDAFLKRHDAAYADDLLGPGRAKLWRDGKITLNDLLGQTGRPLTLEQLRRK